MPSFNKVFLMGYLTQDPVIRSSTSGNSLCSARIAVNRRYRLPDGAMREDSIFISLAIHGRQGDLFFKSLRKGKPVFIEGHLYQHEWVGRTGEKMLSTDVSVENFRFIDPKGELTNPSEPSMGGMSLPPLGNAATYRTPQANGYGGGGGGGGMASSYAPPPPPPAVEPLHRMPEMSAAPTSGDAGAPSPDQLVDDTPF